MARTAEMIWAGDASSLIREAERAEAATVGSTEKMRAATARWSASATAAGDAAARMAAKAKLSYEEQARAAGEAAAKQAEAAGASERAQALAYNRAADAAKAAAIRTTAANEETTHSFKGVGLAATASAGLVVLGIKKAADTTAELAKETLTLHNVTGLSAKSASTYAAVAETQGLNVKQLNQAFGTLSKNVHAVENAHDGLTKAAKTQENAFRQLGLPLSVIVKAHGDLNKLLPEITARFEQLPGSVSKAAIGMALLGRGWQTLVPLMHSGELGLKEQIATAEKMGATLSGTTAQKLKEFAKQQEDAKYASLGLQLAIGQYLAPALTSLIHDLADVAHSIGDGVHWLHEHQTAATALAVVIGTVLGGALTVFAYTRAVAFIGATKEMVTGLKAVAVRMGLTAGAVTAADAEIETANVAAGASFTAMLGPIGLVAAAVAGLNAILPGGDKIQNLLGGNQPGESGREGEVFAKKHGGFGAVAKQKGISSFTNTAIEEAAHRYGISPSTLLGVYGTETSYGRNITTSSAGAMGAFQFIPETARRYHYPLTNHPNAEQFKEQAEAAAHYLSDLVKQAGSIDAALALYSGHTPGYAQKVTANSGGGSAAHHVAAKTRALAQAYVSPFSAASGLVRGREDEGIDFTARPGSKIAAVGQGIIDAIIPNWYKGQPLVEERLTSGSHKGQYVYYAEQLRPSVHVGQAVAAGQAIGAVAASGTGLELGFGAGHGRTLAQATTGYTEGQKTPAAEAFSKFLGSVGKTGTALNVATTVFEQAAKHLTLTPAQTRAVGSLTNAAAASHAQAMLYGGYAGGLGETWQRVRGLRAARSRPLGTGQGNREAAMIDTQDEATAKAQRALYQRAVREIQAEVRQLSKLRAQYLMFSKHARGNARVEALHKAAEIEGRIKQAGQEAKALHGNIAEADTAIESAETVLTTTLPAEVESANLSAYQGGLSKIAAEERAGLLTPDQAQAAKIATANRALSGGYGALSEEGRLTVLGDLRDFSGALREGTEAINAHTEALKESAESLAQFAAIASSIGAVEAGSFAKSLADTVSGQIAGVDYHGRRLTAGSGVAAAY